MSILRLRADNFRRHLFGCYAGCRFLEMLCRLRRLDGDDDHIGRFQEFEAGGKFDVGSGRVLMNAQLRHVDLEVIRQLVDRTFDLDLVRLHVHDAAEIADAERRTDGDDWDPRMHCFVLGDALQIDMDDFAGHRIARNVADERGVALFTLEGQRDYAGAAAVVQQIVEDFSLE